MTGERGGEGGERVKPTGAAAGRALRERRGPAPERRRTAASARAEGRRAGGRHPAHPPRIPGSPKPPLRLVPGGAPAAGWGASGNFFFFNFSGGGGAGLLRLFRGVRAPGPAPLPSSGGRLPAGRAAAAASTMMMSLSSKQPFGLPHGGGSGGGLHETKYSALHTASPCPSAGAAAPAASSPSSTGSGGSAGRGSGSGPGGSGGSGSSSGSGPGGSGGGAEAMRRACLPAPPVGARRPPPRFKGSPSAAPRIRLMIFSWPCSKSPGAAGRSPNLCMRRLLPLVLIFMTWDAACGWCVCPSVRPSARRGSSERAAARRARSLAPLAPSSPVLSSPPPPHPPSLL